LHGMNCGRVFAGRIMGSIASVLIPHSLMARNHGHYCAELVAELVARESFGHRAFGFEITSTNGVPAFARANLSHPTNSHAVLWLSLSRSICRSDHQRFGCAKFRIDIHAELKRL
jgi:hypothetical protein